MKKKLLISFSGGRTSAFMTQWLLKNKSDEFEMIVVFANTGKEREETLVFADRCDKYFGFNMTWVEAAVHPDFGIGTSFKVVDYETANREGGPFEEIIAKYGIPNKAFPHCSRELKERPIRAFAKSIGWDDYYTAIGIRADEIDRMSEKRKENQLVYPLISMIETYKGNINAFWSQQPFDLEIKSYEGNCDVCWKKTTRKLLTIAKENPDKLNWWEEMEKKYENYTPPTRTETNTPYRFFRKNISVDQIRQMAKKPFRKARDESKDRTYRQTNMLGDLDLSFGCSESCEVFGNDAA